MKEDLALIVLDNAKGLGDLIDNHLMDYYKTDESFIIDKQQVRFNNGEGKIVIKETIRNKNVYILCDVGNYDCQYEMFGRTNYLSPDDHFQDLKRCICALSGHAKSLSVIMPLLYESRQHRRKGRESLDCALALQELQRLGVEEIITFDVHDPNIVNAVPTLAFDNFYPSNDILNLMVKNGHIDLDNTDDVLVVSPDMGAVERARFFADILKADIGIYYKRRDLSKIVNGKNPIVAHEYLGKDVKNKTIFIVDDMIASGSSIIDVAENMKQRGAKEIYLIASYAFFTEGFKKFDDAYEKGYFDGIYSTNLSYTTPSAFERKWFYQADCSKVVSKAIYSLNRGESITKLIKGRIDIAKKVK